jgi:lipoprotein-anchoring transpeptidase ErfK/SrfK
MKFKTIIILIVLLAVAGGAGYFGWDLSRKNMQKQSEDQLFQADNLMEEGDYTSAVAVLEKLRATGGLLDDERKAQALSLLASAYEKLNRPETSAIHKQILELYENTSFAVSSLLELARSQEKESPAEAENSYEKLLKRDGAGYYAQAAKIGLARLQYKNGEDEKAREQLRLLVTELDEAQDVKLDELRMQSYALLSTIHSEWLFSREMNDLGQEYTVESGNTLDSIARKFNTDYRYLKRVNELRSANAIRPRMKIKVPRPGGIYLVVDKSDFHLYMYHNDGTFLKWYNCGIGKLTYKTANGEYVINTKLVDTPWTNPKDFKTYRPGDLGYALGEPGKTAYWMGLGQEGGLSRTGLGIHGTNEPDTVGTRSSAGCVRLRHEDIEELFGFARRKTKVIIRD